MKRKNIVGLIAIVAIAAAVMFAGCVEEENHVKVLETTPISTPTPVPHEIVYIVDVEGIYSHNGFNTTMYYHPEEFFTLEHARKYIQSRLDAMQQFTNDTAYIVVTYTGNYTITEYDKEYVEKRIIETIPFEIRRTSE